MKSIRSLSAILLLIVCIFNSGCANKTEESSSLATSSEMTPSISTSSDASSAEVSSAVSMSPTSTPIPPTNTPVPPTKTPAKPTQAPGKITSMSTSNDSSNLYLKVYGTNLAMKSQFFINSDKNYSTGLKTKWVNSGFDFLVENDILYKYTGTPNKWNWTRVVGIKQEKSFGYIIVKVPLASIESKIGSILQIGFVSNDNRALVYPSLKLTIPKYTVK